MMCHWRLSAIIRKAIHSQICLSKTHQMFGESCQTRPVRDLGQGSRGTLASAQRLNYHSTPPLNEGPRIYQVGSSTRPLPTNKR
jgi:hypothetical protein